MVEPMQTEEFDAIIIGAGFSGLAAGIRLAMYDKRVVILEHHSIVGGLNSYYRRGSYKFNVGLHAMTNFTEKGNRRSPLGKILKQLRIAYDDLALRPQGYSEIDFPQAKLKFENGPESLQASVAAAFPHCADDFSKLVQAVLDYNDMDLQAPFRSAKDYVRTFIADEHLLEMIFCPLLIYGSAVENDMDVSQFVIMFKSIFCEGFCSPEGGIRPILKMLTELFKSKGGELRLRSGVQEILKEGQRVIDVKTENGNCIKAPIVLSSMGYPETLRALGVELEKTPRLGPMSFCESIHLFDEKPPSWGAKATVVFQSDTEKYHYCSPDKWIDDRSAVICYPNNFYPDDEKEGVCRVTRLANYDVWKHYSKDEYADQKEILLQNSRDLIARMKGSDLPPLLFEDGFTPTTVEHYTRHYRGAIYGSPDKVKDGVTHWQGLYIIGTDQGFLGIVGSMLSGISMANMHGLKS
jgi:phytoene dehydrogenase-like protein